MNRMHPNGATPRSRRIGATFLALASLAVVGLPMQAEAQDLDSRQRQRLYYDVKPATVLVSFRATAEIDIPSPNGTIQLDSEVEGGGTGWILTPDGFVVTNAHVVQAHHDLQEQDLKEALLFKALVESGHFEALAQQRGQQLTQDEQRQNVQELFRTANIVLQRDLVVTLQNGQVLNADVRQYSGPITGSTGRLTLPGIPTLTAGRDVAILKVPGRDLPTLVLGRSEDMRIGDEIYVAGYPVSVLNHPFLGEETSLEATFTRGQVSGVRVAVEGSDLLQVDAPLSFGNSGGPVLNAAGEVVGIATFVSQDHRGQLLESLSFAIPANVINDFIRASGASPSEGLFNRTWTRALDTYFQGDYQGAVVAFDEVLRLIPGLPDAINLQRTAITERERGNTAPPVVPEVLASEVIAPEAAPAVVQPPASSGANGLPSWMIPLLGAGAALVGLGLYVRGRGESPRPVLAGSPAGAVPASAAATLAIQAPRAGAASLRVTSGPLSGNRFTVGRDGIRIGRDPASCQVVLSEASVSREHAVIRAEGGALSIRNLSGTNPTYVNDRAIQEAALADGDSVRIGDSVFAVEAS
jgi:S1-C subfamily serine protease